MEHTILFSGHMIDGPTRKTPRFPATKEEAVTDNLKKVITSIKEKHGKPGVKIKGIASGACGGDIIFHELCIELQIDSEIYLAMPAEPFKQKSVSFANSDWEKRFDWLINKLPVHVLPPSWGADMNVNIWAATNLWMLDSSMAHETDNITLIALWDGGDADGDGGTEHMITAAKKMQAEIEIIDLSEIQ